MGGGGKRFGIDDAAWAKLDKGLRREVERLRGDPSRALPVMVSLHPRQAVAEGESIGRKEARFLDESRSLMEQLEQLGTTDVQGYWINSTVSARVPIGALNAIGSRADVKQILLLVKQRAVL
jgi:hypothetical protein